TYRLYRGTSPDFVPDASSLIATTTDTSYVDASGAPYNYKLSAVDIHGNESGFALYSAPGAGGVPGSELPVALRLGRPEPNPAQNETRIGFDLPASGTMSLVIYDSLGRVVRRLYRGPHAAGSFTLPWDLADDRGAALRSGVYFVHLEAGGRSLTQRMVTIR